MVIFKPHQFFDLIRSYLPQNPVIIEAGAFDGRDTLSLARFWPHATIHTFEPVPTLFDRLVTNTQHNPHIKRYPIALSDSVGSATFYVSEKPTKPGIPSQASSLLPPKERLAHSSIQFPYTITVPTITLDAWAQEQNIGHIDFLWLDLQGYELAVMQASRTLFATIKVVYTEVSFIESYAGQPQYPEVRNWLESEGFTLIGTDFTDEPTHFFGNALFARV